MTGKFGGGPEELLVNTAAAAVLTFGPPDDDKIVAAQVGDGGFVLDTGRKGIDLLLPRRRDTAGVILPNVHVRGRPAARHVVVVVVPGDGEAAVGQGGHVGLILPPIGGLVDPEFPSHHSTARVIALAVDAGTAAILAIGAPDHHETATDQRRHGRLVLGTAHKGIDLELAAGGDAGAIVALGVNPVARTVGPALVGPHHDEAAIGVGGDVRVVLVAAGRGIHAELGAKGGTGVAVTLRIDAVAAAILAIGIPGDHETAGVGRHAGRPLIGTDVAVDAEFAALSHAAGVVALGIDPVAGAVRAGLIGPGHQKTAVGKAHDARIELMAGRGGIDPEFRAGRNPQGRIALGIDAVASRCILSQRGPHDDVAAAGECRDSGVTLVAVGIGVDLIFAVNFGHAGLLSGFWMPVAGNRARRMQ